jgi:hypothetical protein
MPPKQTDTETPARPPQATRTTPNSLPGTNTANRAEKPPQGQRDQFRKPRPTLFAVE